MNRSDDGLESASLMHHGSGRNYTNESMWQGKEMNNGQTSPDSVNTNTNTDTTTDEKPKVTATELDYLESDAPLLSKFHEDAIQQVIFYLFNFCKIYLYFALGMHQNCCISFI